MQRDEKVLIDSGDAVISFSEQSCTHNAFIRLFSHVLKIYKLFRLELHFDNKAECRHFSSNSFLLVEV